MSILSKPLPFDHLLSIFARVSLPTLLRLPLTCTHWSSLQPTVCRQIHSLTLCISDGTPSRIAHSPFSQSSPILGLPLSTLTISHQNGTLPEPIAHSLLALFPAIHHLNLENNAFNHIHLDSPPPCSTHSLIILLRGWAPTLIRLGIYDFNTNSDSIEAQQQHLTRQMAASASLSPLLSTINTLPFLKHLTISLWNKWLPNEGALYSLRISILSRLQSFFFTSQHSADILLPSLRAYARPTLKELDLGYDAEAIIHRLASEGSPILNSLTHTSYYSYQPPGDFTQIAGKLRNLTHLSLKTGPIHTHTLRRTLQALAKCPALRTLHLYFEKLDHSPVVDPLPELVPVPSLTSFTLKVPFFTTHTLLSTELSFPWLFPNLVNFTLGYFPYSCTVCAFARLTFESKFLTPEVLSSLRTCMHQLVGPLKGCTQLKRITLPKMAQEDYNTQTWEDFPLEKL